VFFGYKVSLAGGGCVMCVFFSATVAHMWTRTGKAEHEDHKKYVASWLAFTWDEAMMPILFATMGAKINVKAIFNGTFFPKAIICMTCSTAVRLIVTFVIQLGSGMPYREKLLVCVGYLGKASAQASVGPIAANLVAGMITALPADQKHSLDTMAEYANNVQQISAMYVMFMACIASLGLVRGGQVVLKREGNGKKSKKKQRGGKSSQHGNGDDVVSTGAGGTATSGAYTGEADVGVGTGVGSTAAAAKAREGSFAGDNRHDGDYRVSFATFEPLHHHDDDDSAEFDSHHGRVR
jgi:solute carrier family 9B (sodium/hydrogen exchanger), member 1/2